MKLRDLDKDIKGPLIGIPAFFILFAVLVVFVGIMGKFVPWFFRLIDL
jgi:hypothetical protein